MHTTLTAKRTNEFLQLFWSACDQSRATKEKAGSTFWYPSAWAYLTLLRQGWAPMEPRFKDEVSEYVQRLFPAGSSLDEQSPVDRFSDEELKDLVLTSWWDSQSPRGASRDMAISTREDLARLALQLLQVCDGDAVADLCCGVGSFMVQTFKSCDPASFYGVDVSHDAVMLACMRASVLGSRISIDLGNMFECEGCYDRIFLDAPWGMRMADFPVSPSSQGIAAGDGAPLGFGFVCSIKRADWIFVAKAICSLKHHGRLVAVLPTSTLTGMIDEEVRRGLVRNRCIEAVIALPKGLVPGTMVAANLVVLAHGSAEQVTFVDMSDFGTGRMPIVLAEGSLEALADRLANPDGVHSASATYQEIAAEGWSLAPQRYLNRIDLEGAVPLGSLIMEVGRGSPDSKVRQRVCDEQTAYRYLEIRNVDDDGNIGDLSCLTAIEPREQRYCLQEGDIVLGKMRPYKVAVAHVPKGQAILCSGNFFIIRPDREKVDPAYLRLFFESAVARRQIDRVSVSSAVTTFNVADLKKLQVPLVPLDEQRDIARRYESLAAEVTVYRRRIEKAHTKMAELFPGGGEA